MSREMFAIRHTAPVMVADGEAEVSLYGEIIQDMPENWKWSKEDKSASEFDKAIKQARKDGAKKLNLRVNCPGGIVTEAVAMRGILNGAGFDDINIRIEGLCASAATLIASLPQANVEIMEGSYYMIHNPWNFAFGNAKDMEHEAEVLRQMEKSSRDMYAAKTQQSEEQLTAWMDEEKWFTAEDAVKYGFADKVLKAAKKEPEAACVRGGVLAKMKAMYAHVPEEVKEMEDGDGDGDGNGDGDSLSRIMHRKYARNGLFPAADGQSPSAVRASAERSGADASADSSIGGGSLDGGLPQSPTATAPSTEGALTGAPEIKDAPEEEKAPEKDLPLMAKDNGNHGKTPIANKIASKEEESMDIKDITLEQLQAENAPLYERIMKDGAQAERTRIQDIHDLTGAGYEEMAEKAIADGTSAMDFHKAVVKAQREKGANYLTARAEETKPAEKVAGGAAEEGVDEMAAFTKDIKALAENEHREMNGGMY